MIGLVGRKVGMTRIFNEDGVSVPVTVIEIEANRVTQVKTLENDGYTAVQVTTGSKKANRVTKPEAGHFVKAGVEAGRGLWEFRTEGEEFTLGQEINVDIFADVKKVDVTGTSKGKGFQGGVNVGTSVLKMLHTVTLYHIVYLVLLVKTKLQVVCLKVKKWQDI